MYDISEFIETTLVKMLKEFKEKHMGYPIGINEEKWEEIINKMIFLLIEMNEETCSKQYTGKNKDKYVKICNYRTRCKNEFYNLLKKYHWDLWW